MDESPRQLLRDACEAVADWINGAPCPDPAYFRSVINRLDALAESSSYRHNERAVTMIETSTGDRLRAITAAMGSEFKDGLASLVNRCSLENGCDLPDYAIADYLVACYVALCDARKPT